MKRPTVSGSAPKGKVIFPDQSFVKKFPTIGLGMADCWWEDGKPRVCWTLSIAFDGPVVNLSLTDKEHGQSLYTTAESIEGALALMEGALADGSASWRRWKKK